MNHFTNCMAPSFVFPVVGTSLTDAITNDDDGAVLPVGYNDPQLALSMGGKSLQEKNIGKLRPSEGPRLCTEVGWSRDNALVLSSRYVCHRGLDCPFYRSPPHLAVEIPRDART